MKNFLFLIVLLILSATPINAQEAVLGDWIIYVGTKQLNNKWSWQQSFQYRSYNIIDDLHQILVRNGIGYDLSDNNNNVSIGYDYVLDKQYDVVNEKSISNNEHRIYQQFFTKQHFGKFYLGHRYRFEERFINDQYKFRFRYFLLLKIALNNPELTDKTYYISAYNEIFLKTTDNNFEQNWTYTGLGYKLNKTFNFEVGYMNQSFAESRRDQINLATFVSF